MNETRLWFCNLCVTSKAQKFIVLIEKYELIEPNNIEIDFKIDNCLRDCYYNCLHTFKTAYDVEMKNGHSFISILSN